MNDDGQIQIHIYPNPSLINTEEVTMHTWMGHYLCINWGCFDSKHSWLWSFSESDIQFGMNISRMKSQIAQICWWFVHSCLAYMFSCFVALAKPGVFMWWGRITCDGLAADWQLSRWCQWHDHLIRKQCNDIFIIDRRDQESIHNRSSLNDQSTHTVWQWSYHSNLAHGGSHLIVL